MSFYRICIVQERSGQGQKDGNKIIEITYFHGKEKNDAAKQHVLSLVLRAPQEAIDAVDEVDLGF
jgi:hypothetical protein